MPLWPPCAEGLCGGKGGQDSRSEVTGAAGPAGELVKRGACHVTTVPHGSCWGPGRGPEGDKRCPGRRLGWDPSTWRTGATWCWAGEARSGVVGLLVKSEILGGNQAAQASGRVDAETQAVGREVQGAGNYQQRKGQEGTGAPSQCSFHSQAPCPSLPVLPALPPASSLPHPAPGFCGPQRPPSSLARHTLHKQVPPREFPWSCL